MQACLEILNEQQQNTQIPSQRVIKSYLFLCPTISARIRVHAENVPLSQPSLRNQQGLLLHVLTCEGMSALQ